jgi:hypothetical protein
MKKQQACVFCSAPAHQYFHQFPSNTLKNKMLSTVANGNETLDLPEDTVSSGS